MSSDSSLQGGDASTSSKSAGNQSAGKLFLDLIVCILIPTLILKKLSGAESLGPMWAFALAISLPLGMALYDFYAQRRVGLVSAIGFISILLTGGIGLFKLPKEYIAYKEALIPAVFAALAIFSTFTKKPLVRLFIYNDALMETERVAVELDKRKNRPQFERVMVRATWLLATSFVLSSILNFVLAKVIIVSDTGTEAFNSELGTMTLLSYPVIVIPCMAVTIYTLFYVMRNIRLLTDLTLEQVIRQ